MPSESLVEDVTIDDVPPTAPGERTDLLCPDCKSCNLRLLRSKHGFFYGCPKFYTTGCKGSVSADAYGSPRGTPAPQDTRTLRKQAIELLAKRQRLTGADPYRLLKELLGIDTNVGCLDEDQARKVVQALRHELGDYNRWDRLRDS